jgi:hypothetical protein
MSMKLPTSNVLIRRVGASYPTEFETGGKMKMRTARR